MTNPTLKKIAETLGISVSTVFRALKKHPDISEATRQKVMDLAQTLTENNKTITLQTAHTCSSEEARIQTNRFLADKNNRPDTVFCMSDEILIGVMKALQENDLRPPTAIAVIAISNGFIPKLFYPEITYVETSGKQLGELAFARMLQCIEGALPSEEIILESRLVEGGSL